MAESSSSRPAERSSYHHFVPQFILRNFAHEYQPSSKSDGKRKAKQRIYPGDKLVKGISLSGPTVALVNTKVAKTFGVQDLYVDAVNSTDKEHIEKLLSKLESSASTIIARVRDSHESGDKLITLRRGEKDVLRKFLFIMKYRRPNVRDRYVHSIEDSEGTEKEALQKYMQDRGFQRPLDVWLDNIKAMLDIKIGVGREWEEKLLRKAYPPDALEFIVHTRMFYLSFCTPADHDDEFLMTENSYGIHEGPKSTIADPYSGKILITFHTEYHTFAHIAPNLTMILRSFLLPSPRDDLRGDIRRTRKMLQDFHISMHNFPERAKSFLEDLPVTKARNSYSRIVDGRTVLTRMGSVLKPDDKFFFHIFPISTDHVEKINMILLDEAWPTSLILFKNKHSARRALEHYLTFDPPNPSHGLKLVFPGTESPRETYFRNLEAAVKLLGGNVLGGKVSAVYRFDDGTLEGVLTRDEDQLIDLVSQNDEVLQAYYKISNKEVLDRRDLEQSRKMLRLRIKIDTWTKGLDEGFRKNVRVDLGHLYLKLPPQRLWIYLKRWRFMRNGGTILGLRNDVHDYRLPAELLPGPEDVIAKMREIFLPTHLSRMMYCAAENHLALSDPEFGLLGELNFDKEGSRRIAEEQGLVFGSQGSICDCGIKPIQITARYFYASFQIYDTSILEQQPLDPMIQKLLDRLLTPEQRIEMATRVAVKALWMDILKDELLHVLFNIIFPVFLHTPREKRPGTGQSEA